MTAYTAPLSLTLSPTGREDVKECPNKINLTFFITRYILIYMKKLMADLRLYRLKHGLTQVKLAKKLGVTFCSVNRWLKGRQNPSELQVYKIEQLIKKR
jgi:DNA-binding XRE family transcriptional regulator